MKIKHWLKFSLKRTANIVSTPFFKGGGEQKSWIFEKGGLAEGQKKGLTKRGGFQKVGHRNPSLPIQFCGKHILDF